MNLFKSTFIRGLQCEKSPYLYKHHYNLKDTTPTSLQAVFDQELNIVTQCLIRCYNYAILHPLK